MWQKIKVYGTAIAIPLAVGGLSALITKDSMDMFDKINQPFLSPPSWLFPVVWTVLYILMGISIGMIYESNNGTKEDKKKAFVLYGLNLMVNFFWSIIFFNFQAFLIAFLWLILLIFIIMKMRKRPRIPTAIYATGVLISFIRSMKLKTVIFL